MDSVVRGGTLATASATFQADIGIEGGKVVALGQQLEAGGAQEIDARGCLVVPGAVDVHTHFDTTVGDATTADDYESGSRAAAAGGITTFVNFAFQEPGESLRDAVERELRKARGKSYLDYGVHIAITDPAVPGVLDEIAPLADEGVASVKVFSGVSAFQLSYREILTVLQAAREAGVMVNVHAEDGPLVDQLTRRLLEAGRMSVSSLPTARLPEAEALATAHISGYARVLGTPVYFVHLSCRQALDAVRRVRRQGGEIYVETRPAYLFLDESRYHLPDREGNKFVCWPPLRSKDDQEALWDGLRNQEIQTYATDHTTWLLEQKMAPTLTFAEIPGGVSNVQTSVGMLYEEGVKRGRISINQFVAVTATNPAKLFGMWPVKGTLAIGADADLVLIDPEKPVHIAAQDMESRSDFDPYEGYQGAGWPVLTMSRGEVVVEGGRIVAQPRRGRFLRRTRYQPL
jgi:dihydropyrimidinase